MPTKVQIRLLEPADVPALLAIIADSRAEYGIAERGVELLEPADPRCTPTTSVSARCTSWRCQAVKSWAARASRRSRARIR